MTDQKDQILILKALNNLKNKIKFKCLILGKGTNKLKLNNFIINNKLKDQIKLSGFKFNPYPYMKMTNLFILSSRYEGLPNVLLEAQYLEKFIISTNCPTGPREILLDGKAGKLIKVGNQGQLEKAILYYYNNRNSSEVTNKIRFGKKNMKRFDFKINCYKYYMVIKKYI
jgi:glycosyltransferase involved in cell wall biosynthesis